MHNANVVYISNSNIYTPYIFYNHTIPSIKSSILKNFNSKIRLSIANVQKIDPLVLPNLINLGLILKNFYGEPVELEIEYDVNLIKYLYFVEFIKYATKDDIYIFDNKFIGGFQPHNQNISDLCKLFLFDSNMIKPDIAHWISITYGKSFYSILRSNIFVENFIIMLSELIDNAIRHSASHCYVSFHLSKQRGVLCSISDIGVGISNERTKRDYNISRDQKFTEKYTSKRVSDLIEKILFRYKESIYGIYNVVEDVVRKDGVVRIHSFDSQAILTNSLLDKFYTIDNYQDLSTKLKQNLLENSNYRTDTKYSSFRIFENIFAGVHIEIEIPGDYYK